MKVKIIGLIALNPEAIEEVQNEVNRWLADQSNYQNIVKIEFKLSCKFFLAVITYE